MAPTTALQALTRIAELCPAYEGGYTPDCTPSDFGNPEDFMREMDAMRNARIGDIARAALSAPAQDAQADTAQLFREALAWGMVYGPEIPRAQWDQLRDDMAAQFAARTQPATPARSGITVIGEVCGYYAWERADGGMIVSQQSPGREWHMAGPCAIYMHAQTAAIAPADAAATITNLVSACQLAASTVYEHAPSDTRDRYERALSDAERALLADHFVDVTKMVHAQDAAATVPQAPRAFRTPEPGTPWWQTAKDCGAWTDRQEGDVGYVHFGSTEALRVYTVKIANQVRESLAATPPAAPQAPSGQYFEGVNTERLQRAMAQAGEACEVSMEALAAPGVLAGHINRMTAAVVRNAQLVQAAQPAGMVPLTEIAGELLFALDEMEKEKSDYMLRKKLGDPSRESTTMAARAAIAKARAAGITPAATKEQSK